MPPLLSRRVHQLQQSIRAVTTESAMHKPPRWARSDWIATPLIAADLFITASFYESQKVFVEPSVWVPLVWVSAGVLFLTVCFCRRTRPLLTVLTTYALLAGGVLVVFLSKQLAPLGATMPLEVALPVSGRLVQYSLGRWGSGKQIVLGGFTRILFTVIVLMAPPAMGIVPFAMFETASGIVGSVVLFITAISVGFSIRSLKMGQTFAATTARTEERRRIARELHDSVAHHLAAVIIQTKATKTIADHDDQLSYSLNKIEQQASSGLGEVRNVVRVLRDDTDATFRQPQSGLTEIHQLASNERSGPVITVKQYGDLDDLTPSLEKGIFRIAQEATTNALRHATNATKVAVTVFGQSEAVELLVADNGDDVSTTLHVDGFGIVGMSERALLLGGSLRSGPTRSGGWSVYAKIPKQIGTTS